MARRAASRSRRSRRLVEEGRRGEEMGSGETAACVGSVRGARGGWVRSRLTHARGAGGGGQGLEADPRNGGKKTYQILVLLSFFLGVEIYKGS
jgi:hypothetical protein